MTGGMCYVNMLQNIKKSKNSKANYGLKFIKILKKKIWAHYTSDYVCVAGCS